MFKTFKFLEHISYVLQLIKKKIHFEVIEMNSGYKHPVQKVYMVNSPVNINVLIQPKTLNKKTTKTKQSIIRLFLVMCPVKV